jgi:hypothetical protein
MWWQEDKMMGVSNPYSIGTNNQYIVISSKSCIYAFYEFVREEGTIISDFASHAGAGMNKLSETAYFLGTPFFDNNSVFFVLLHLLKRKTETHASKYNKTIM